MKQLILQHRQFFLLVAIAAIFLLGASHPSFAQAGIGAKYGSRDPRTCADKQSPKSGAPSSAQAAQYVICESEHVINDLYLVKNVTVQVGSGRPYNLREDINFPDIDTKYSVYPIRGSFQKYNCGIIYLDRSNLNKNCALYDQPNAKGACYKTNFGEWRCGMTDASTSRLITENVPPPDPQQTPAPAGKNTASSNPPRNETKSLKDKSDIADKGDDGYTKPDFSAMENWFEIVRYEYVPLEKTMYVYIKPKVANTPTEFQMEFRDKDNLLMQDREVSYFHLMPGTNDAKVGDTVKVYVTTPTEKNLEKIATAKVVRIVK